MYDSSGAVVFKEGQQVTFQTVYGYTWLGRITEIEDAGFWVVLVVDLDREYFYLFEEIESIEMAKPW